MNHGNIQSNELDNSGYDEVNPIEYPNSNNLCRQIENEDDSHLSDDSGWDVNFDDEDEVRNFAASFVNLERQQPLMEELGNMEKEVTDRNVGIQNSLGDQSIRLFNTDIPETGTRLPSLPYWKSKKHLKCKSDIFKMFIQAVGAGESAPPSLSNSSTISNNQLQQSKKSLPHKKRISKRLKKNNQTMREVDDSPHGLEIVEDTIPENYQSTQEHHPLPTGINEAVHMDRIIFVCQLCGGYFGDDQFKFFFHLKEHYEPHDTSLMLDSIHHNGNAISINKIDNAISVDNEPLPDSLVDLSLDNAVSSKSLYQSQNKISEYDTEKTIFNPSLKSLIYSNDDKSMLNPNTHRSFLFHSNMLDKLLQAGQCPKPFKRQKQSETHTKEIHPSKADELSEFSEPEDLMEGIHVVVEAENEDYLQDDLSSQHSNTLIIQTMDNQDQYILPHLTIENGQMIQQPHLPSKEWFVKESISTESSDNTSSAVKTPPIEENHIDENVHVEYKNESINYDELVICPLCGDIFTGRKKYEVHVQQSHIDMKEEELEGILAPDIPDTEPGEIVTFNESPIDEDSEGVEEMEFPEKDKKSKKKVMFKCTECGKQFKYKNSLMCHIVSHKGTKSFQCKICPKSFMTASALKVHTRLHSGDRPYKCIECNKRFRQWGDLKYHFISIHSNLKQHQCEFCGKNFARKYSLIIHRRIHTGEKSYCCEFCNKTFRASSYLQSHRKIHTGERPYPCTLCDKKFRMKGDMRRHLRTHNNKETGEKRKLNNKVNNLKALSVSSNKSDVPAKLSDSSDNNSNEVIQITKEESLCGKEDTDSEDKKDIKIISQEDGKLNPTFSLDPNSAVYVWPLYIS